MENPDAGKMRLKVLVRLRPTPEGYPSLVHADHRVLYMKDPIRGHSNEFVFDGVFSADAKQDAVFKEVGMPLVEHVMQGYNACCLAYGHTGSGKTYAMFGREPSAASDAPVDKSEWGIIPRCCEAIAKAASVANRKADHVEASSNGTGVRIKLFVSFMEVYMENVRDLGAAAQAYLRAHGARLPGGRSSESSGHGHSSPPAVLGLTAFASADGGAPTRGAAAAAVLRDPADYVRTNLDVMEDAYGMTYVKDLRYIEVTDVEDMLALLHAGYAARPSSPIDLASRAHTIFSISVVTYRGGDQQPVTGRLNLVDLAGSEKQSRSGPEGHRLREASVITKSLTALGKVVVALSQAPSGPLLGSRATSLHSLLGASGASGSGTSSNSGPHVPYRDSKLTRVLKDCLCGRSAVTLLGCVLPVFDELEESLATLQFAARVITRTNTLTAAPLQMREGGGGGAAGSGGGMTGDGAAAADPAFVEELTSQVAALKDELEVTHAHYQKLIEQIAGPSWRSDPGPVERAPGFSGGGGLGPGGVGPSGMGAGGGGGGGGTAAAAAADAANGTALNAFAAALASLGRPGGGGGGPPVRGGGGGDERQRASIIGNEGGGAKAPRQTVNGISAVALAAAGNKGGGGGGAAAGGGGGANNATANSRISLLEAQVRKLESQLNQARTAAQQYEERLSARKEELELARERMAGKEHAQFAEIKKLRAQVTELTKALEAERIESTQKLEDAKRRSDEECARLMRDIDTLRNQLAQVTGTVSNLVEKHSAAISAEKRQREAVKKQATQLLQQQFARGSEEHRCQVENLKQQSSYLLARRGEELGEVRRQLEGLRAAHAAERGALLAELEYLASYSERVTELVRRMEAGVVPVTERGSGVKAFRLPQRERPPRLESSRLAVLKERSAELHERLLALSAATSSPTQSYSLNGSASGASSSGAAPPPAGAAAAAAATAPGGGGGSGSSGGGPTFGGWVGVLSPASTSPGRGGGGGVLGGCGGHSPLGSSVDLDALRAQVEAELKAQVTARVVGDLRSEKTVEYIRQLESAVGRYRQELQSEKKRFAEMAVALRSVQRQHSRPESPIARAMAAHSPAGTIKMAPNWGLGHTHSPAGGGGGAIGAGVGGGGASPRGGALGSTSGGSGGVAGPGAAVLVPPRPATATGIVTAGLRGGPHSASRGEPSATAGGGGGNGRAPAPSPSSAAGHRPLSSTSMAALTSSFRGSGVPLS